MSFSPTLPTPLFPHLRSSQVYNDVYVPAEDSFLLMDALEQEAVFLNQLRPLICMEVGSGSGVVLTFLAKLLALNSFLWAVDVNTVACRCTKETLSVNTVASPSDTLAMDLLINFRMRLRKCVDVLIFNPPYVVTPSEEVGGGGIEASWAGGVDGREVIDRFLPYVPDILSPQGILYLVLIKENRPEEICQALCVHGFKSETVLRRMARNEALSVFKFSRKS